MKEAQSLSSHREWESTRTTAGVGKKKTRRGEDKETRTPKAGSRGNTLKRLNIPTIPPSDKLLFFILFSLCNKQTFLKKALHFYSIRC